MKYSEKRKCNEEKEDGIVNANTNTDNLKMPVSTYNCPIVPEGFKKIETEFASWELEEGIPKGWNKGLVIEDEIGNQFVWVPVNIDKMNVKDTYHKDLMEIVWNFIEWGTAQKNAEIMYNNENIESSLVTQKQWNYMMYWLEENGYDIENSIKWGNHCDSNFEFTGYYSIDYGKTYQYGENKMKQTYNMILSTGATQRNMANNIYDLAGNVSEFVETKDGENLRGGNYDNLSYLYSANRNWSIAEPNSRQGFRVVIYFK